MCLYAILCYLSICILILFSICYSSSVTTADGCGTGAHKTAGTASNDVWEHWGLAWGRIKLWKLGFSFYAFTLKRTFSMYNLTLNVIILKVNMFWQAARYNDMEDIVSLASIGIPLDSKDDQGRTGIIYLLC